MEARNGSETAGGGRPKLLPITSNPDFDFKNWKVFFMGHAGKFPGGREVLLKEVIPNETAAAKLKRLKDDYAANAIALSMLYEVSQNDTIASGVVTSQAALEPEPSSHNLMKLLDLRFTQKRKLRLQKLTQDFHALKVKTGETSASFVDRYKILTTTIIAIDPAQLPTEITRQGVLLNAIVLAFPMLWTLLSDQETSEVDMLDKILNHRMPNAIGRHEKELSEAVASYLANNEQPQKARKREYRKPSAKDTTERKASAETICWECEIKGHFTKDCKSKLRKDKGKAQKSMKHRDEERIFVNIRKNRKSKRNHLRKRNLLSNQLCATPRKANTAPRQAILWTRTAISTVEKVLT